MSPTGCLHALRGDGCADGVRYGPREPIELAEPFPVTLDLAALAA